MNCADIFVGENPVGMVHFMLHVGVRVLEYYEYALVPIIACHHAQDERLHQRFLTQLADSAKIGSGIQRLVVQHLIGWLALGAPDLLQD